MEYDEFVSRIKERIEELVGKEDITVRIEHVIKNNDVEYDGLVILEKDNHISPNIYLDYFYDEFKSGKSIESISKEIIAVYHNNKEKISLNPTDIEDFNKIKDKLVFKLVNRKMNEKNLQNLVHRPYLDLEILYYVVVKEHMDYNLTLTIQNSLLKIWEVSEEELYEIAYANTKRIFGVRICRMIDLIKELMISKRGESIEQSELSFEELDSEFPMYVITNNAKTFGASILIYKDVFREFARERKKNLYIIPSSVHELIVIFKDKEKSKSKLKSIVRDVNASEVHPLEILSDTVYEYSYRKDEIRY